VRTRVLGTALNRQSISSQTGAIAGVSPNFSDSTWKRPVSHNCCRKRHSVRSIFAIALVAVSACAHASVRRDIVAREPGWVATWAPSQQLTEPHNMPPAPGLRGSTLRQVLRVTLGGTRLRLRISNVFGDVPVALSSVHLARSAGSGAVVPMTDRALTFAGRLDAAIPPGRTLISDPIDYEIAPLSDLTVTMYIERISDRVTGHPGSRATSYLKLGNHVTAVAIPDARPVEHWYLLAGVDVWRDDDARVIVALGNSITDGRGSGTDRNTRWTDYLAARLHATDARIAVVNAGLGGNALLRGGLGPPALERLDRDVLDQPGAQWVVVFLGINDIGNSRANTTANITDELIAGYSQIIARARARGLRVYGATLLPFGGSQYDSDEHEDLRKRVNHWIRTSSAYDAVIDLDAALRDAADPSRLSTVVDSGDHLHLNEVGYRILAETIDLGLFTR
jgi:lysophospholipase L1-like esterase